MELQGNDQIRLAYPYLLAEENKQQYMNYGIPMYQACLRGDWEAVRLIYNSHPISITAAFTERGINALHIAAAARRTHLAVELVGLMIRTHQTENLALQTFIGNTALCIVAFTGIVSVARVMVDAYGDMLPSLPMIRGSEGLTPLHIAALSGQGEMVRYLWPLTRAILKDDELLALLISTINTELYDEAMSILKEDDNGRLAIAKDKHKQTPLHVLARKSMKSPESGLHNWRPCYNTFDNSNERIQQNSAQKLVEYLWREVLTRLTFAGIEDLMGPSWQLLFVAVQAGNFEFVTSLIRFYPELIWKFDEKKRSLFHVAVQYRQEKIFRLIYDVGAVKYLLAMYTDVDGNSMLHYAAMLPSSDRLSCISGAALQMQREMLWFKAVEDWMQPHVPDSKNIRGKLPRELLREEHEGLRKEGEKWMRKTATSCSLAATLIAGVVFQVTLKVPGGDGGCPSNSGSYGLLYWLLAISDSLSLISSTASIFMFLSILLSTYAMEDFLHSLPLKLLTGLFLLLISIITMMLAFTASFCMIFKHRLLQIGAFILALFLIFLLLILISPLLRKVYRSTCGCNSLFKPLARHQIF